MYRKSCSFRLCKVQFGHRVGLGLVAKRDIEGGTFLWETCTSMTIDVVAEPGPSTIESDPKQLGPHGDRGLNGPIRFANHKCKGWNAQVSMMLAL